VRSIVGQIHPDKFQHLDAETRSVLEKATRDVLDLGADMDRFAESDEESAPRLGSRREVWVEEWDEWIKAASTSAYGTDEPMRRRRVATQEETSEWQDWVTRAQEAAEKMDELPSPPSMPPQIRDRVVYVKVPGRTKTEYVLVPMLRAGAKPAGDADNWWKGLFIGVSIVGAAIVVTYFAVKHALRRLEPTVPAVNVSKPQRNRRTSRGAKTGPLRKTSRRKTSRPKRRGKVKWRP
jgi:hypothetical protein